MTALFADLVSSTALSDQHDPEVVRAVVSQFFERAIAEIRGFGGSAEQFRGDAIMAMFGLQQAHEDDPERAVRAAFAVLNALAELAPDAAERHGITLQARIGIESGEVVTGDPFGGSTMATGDVLNLAARLEEQAGPGEVMVGPVVHEATANTVTYEPAGTHDIKGKAAPVAIWRAVEVRVEPGVTVRGIVGHTAPLTGRDEELQLLHEAARRARTERKAILFTILGLPGVGKSRLVRELGEELRTNDWHILRGRCLPYGEGITYWPLGEIVRGLSGITAELSSAEALERIHAAAPDDETAERLAFAIGLVPAAPVSGESVDRDIALAFRRLLEAASAERPVLLVVEDIHWAEPPLLDLLEYAATWIRDRPILIVCLARPDLYDRRPSWGSGRMEATRLQLEPLTREETSALVDALLTAGGLPPEFRRQVLDRAEGNPLFVEETVRMLLERGAIVEQDGQWVATDAVHEVAVPETIEALIRARLDALPREERSVLQGASVIGRVFQRSAVATLMDEPVEMPLEQAVLRDLVSEEPADDPSYRFKHVIIRDVAYESLPKARRADLHQRTVAWLTDWAGDRRDEFVEIEAHHLEQAVRLLTELNGKADANLLDLATDALRRSADKAAERDDLPAVILFTGRALALDPPSSDSRAEIEALLVEALFERGEFGRGREIGAALVDEAATLGRRDLRGRALLRLGLDAAVSDGDHDRLRAAELLGEARADLQAAGDVIHESDLVYYLGFNSWLAADLPTALEVWREAADLARAAGDAGRETRARQRIIHVLFELGRRDEAERLLERSVEQASELSLVTQAGVWKSQGQYLTRYGVDIPAGRDLLRRAAEVGEEVGDFDLRYGSLVSLAEIDLVTGDAAQALAWSEEVVAFVTRLGHAWMMPEAERRLAHALLTTGSIAEAATHAEHALEIVVVDDTLGTASARLALATVRDAQGREAEAAELFAQAAAVVETSAFQTDRAAIELSYGAFHLANGRTVEGEALVSQARERYEAFLGPQTPFLPYVDRVATAARSRAVSR